MLHATDYKAFHDAPEALSKFMDPKAYAEWRAEQDEKRRIGNDLAQRRKAGTLDALDAITGARGRKSTNLKVDSEYKSN